MRLRVSRTQAYRARQKEGNNDLHYITANNKHIIQYKLELKLKYLA